MDAFLEMLRREHRALAASLSRIETLGLTTPDAVAAAQEFGEIMRRHRENEDDKLYPLLETLDDRATAAMITRMKAASAETTRKALALMQRSVYTSCIDDFEGEFRRLRDELGARIHQEETELFPIYARLAEAASRFY